MKNIYKITKGQLITLIIFGVIGWFVALSEAEYSGFSTFLSVLIPAILIFYYIGWKNSNKEIKILEEIPSIQDNFEFPKIKFNKKKFIKVIAGLILLSGITWLSAYLIDLRNESLRRKEITQKYNDNLPKINILQQQVTSCVTPVLEKKYKEAERDCNLLRNKIKQEYNFCTTLSPVTSPASCLYDHDYEKIDCSEETLNLKARSKLTEFDLPLSCRTLANELMEAKKIIEEYNKLIK